MLFGLSVHFGYNSPNREISMSEITDITISPEFLEKWKFVLKDFYDIFTDVMHRHGTPVFSPRLFEVLSIKYLGFLGQGHIAITWIAAPIADTIANMRK
jgi:hypothetical protein